MPQTHKKYTVLVLMTSTQDWRQLTPDQRGHWVQSVLGPIFGRYADRVTVRFLDVGGFTARCTDVTIFETNDLKDYDLLMEELRGTELFTVPYFVIRDIIPGLGGEAVVPSKC